MWGVFELDRDAWRREGQALLPSAKHRANMKRLLHMLGWTTADQQQGLEEYEQGFKVAHMWATKHKSSDRDAGARVATIPRFKKLKRVICIMLCFLFTETECERAFAEELHSGRPRMDTSTRFECLNVKTDGVPFCELHEEGKPVNNFWRCCQDAYAKRFGTKHLQDEATRSDAGKQRTKHVKRDGKDTAASFKRQRQEVLHSAQEACPRASEDATETVFGYGPVGAGKLKELRKQEEGKAYKELMVNMEKRFKEKLEETNKVLLQRPEPFPSAIYQMPSAERWSVSIRSDKKP
jgi:hypothetical protein